MAVEDFMYDDRQSLGREYGTPATRAPSPFASAIPSWLRPDGSDARGRTPYSQISYAPDSRYRLIDNTGRNDNTVLGEAATPEEFSRLAAIVNSQLVPKGRSADWRLEQQVGDAWNTVGGDNYNRSGLSYVADIGLPIAGALLAPLTGGASAALLAGLGAAGGSALSGTIQGRKIGDIAKGAVISGLGAGLGAGAFGALSGGASSAAGGAAGSAGSAAGGGLASIAPVAGEMLVSNTVLPSLGAIFGGAAGGGAGAAASTLAARPSNYTTDMQPGDSPMLQSTGARFPSIDPLASLGGSFGAAGGSLAAQPPPPVDPTEMIVSANRPGSLSLDSASLAAGLGGAGASALNLGDLSVPNAPQKPDTLDKIRAGLSLASLVGGALGGGQPTGAADAGGVVKPNIDPIFSAQLPGASAQYSGNNLAARDMSGTDWNRYGFGPEQSFFNNVPQGFAEGGGVDGGGYAPREEFAVHGAGSGRDDAIDAKLSDGEYVIDAETVALLGDGSNKEGAARLDSLRVNLRKHKGRNLARGQFSVKAKAPEAYLAGGRN